MKNRTLKLVFAFSLAAFLCGCDSEVEKVKNGTLNGYEQTTIGRAIESVLGNVEWKYFETEKGVRVVEASGWPGKQLIPLAERKKQCDNPQKVVVQFVLHTNTDSFEVSYCGIGENPYDCGEFLNYIYANNSSYDPIKIPCSIRKSFTDSRDQKEYKTVIIGDQEWMAENLNYEMEESYCDENNPSECQKNGRLYTWDAAMYACPEGWRLPSKGDFETLINVVGGDSIAGTVLKAASGWGFGWKNEPKSYDIFSFNALPAGEASLGRFEGGMTRTTFWSSTEYDSAQVYCVAMTYDREDAALNWFYKEFSAYSVRCIKDTDGSGEAVKAERKRMAAEKTRVAEEKAMAEAKNSTETFIDPRDQNKYRVVKIGNQRWMAENMRYAGPSKDSVWGVAYAQDSETNLYGRLYEWSDAMEVCPTGWHLPDLDEFRALAKTVGGDSIAGKRLKSVDHWEQNKNGTDDYSFRVLPAGSYAQEKYDDIGSRATFWVRGEDFYMMDEDGLNEPGSNTFEIESSSDAVLYNSALTYTYNSVRCVMD